MVGYIFLAVFLVVCGGFLFFVLILRVVRIRVNRVVLNMIVLSLFRGMFMEIRRWRGRGGRVGDYRKWFFTD